MRRGGETPSCEGCGVLYSVEEVACSDRHGVQEVVELGDRWLIPLHFANSNC